MQRWKFLLGMLSAFFILMVLPGCTALDMKSGGRLGSAGDIQERLSAVIARNGFTHSLRSERSGGVHVDSIYISVPLDSLKRRHYSLENLMRDVGQICALPEYATLPIHVEFAAGDDEDRHYLQALLFKEVDGKRNVSITVESDFFNDILITTSHSVSKGR